MSEGNVLWYRIELPRKPMALAHEDLDITDASSEDGLRLFAQTHLKAYGEEMNDESLEMVRLDVEEGVVDRDKMWVALKEGTPVACISYEILAKPDGSRYALLHNLGVPVGLQGEGLGADLIRRLLNNLNTDFGPGTWVLTDCSPDQRGPRQILEKVGFATVEPEPWFPSPPSQLD